MKSLRRELSFNFDWEFALTDQPEAPGAEVAFRPVQLPHDWSADYEVQPDAPSCGSGGYARTGIGWYRKDFDWDAPAGRQVSLLFDGVYMNCDLWVNGKHAAHHVYGYTSFEVKLTSLLRKGKNEILLRVDNSHQPNSRWYSGSGITRGVTWMEHGPAHLPLWGVCVRSTVRENRAEVEILTDVANPERTEGLELIAAITDPKGRPAAEARVRAASAVSQTLRQTLSVPNPTLWDLDCPALYLAEVRLIRDDEILDCRRVPFGIRTISFTAENGFALNGRKQILKGVCLHHDGGGVGAAVPPAVWKRRLEKLKDMGCNALRCSHNPPDPALLCLADEMGFAVMDEAFDEWRHMKGKEFGSNTHESRGYSEWFDSCWQEDVRAMILRDRNHPSIVMWSAGNEIGEQITGDGPEILKEIVGLCHALDPTRPVTAACDQVKAEPKAASEEFLQGMDLVGVNYADRWRGRTETFWMEEKTEHPEWKLLGTEDIAVNGRRGDYRLETEESVWGRTPYYARMLKAEKLWKFIRTRPFMIGSFMWTGIDYLGECFWPDKGSSAGVLDTCGFEKDGYWFYRSLWRQDVPTLFAAPYPDPEIYGRNQVIPVIVYTNAFRAELFLGEQSYGVKAFEFPAQGMTKHWAHFDRRQSPVTTNDLHLSWDVPCTGEPVTVVGYDEKDQIISRVELLPPMDAAYLTADPDRKEVAGDGEDVIQIEIALRDASGRIAAHADRTVCVTAENGVLLSLDNGDPADHTLCASPRRSTFHGRALAVIRPDRGAETVRIRAEAEGLPRADLTVPVVRNKTDGSDPED
ncbi:MAG: DUF4982 domain-containing protein [Clostridia bacterium]|nr:DUF4982 domain-containing protein [Clostridia bacterium]